MKTNVLIQALVHVHRETRLRHSNAREADVKSYNEKAHVRSVNFEVGDYVLVAQKAGTNGHKLRVIWQGLQRVTGVYVVLDTTANNNSNLHAVEKLLDLRFNGHNDQYEVYTKWLGFDHETPTSEPFTTLQENIPAMHSCAATLGGGQGERGKG